MEQALWFAFGSFAGAAITGLGRPIAMGIVTAAIRAGDAVSAARDKVGGAIAARTEAQRKSLGTFLEEAKSRARAAHAEPAPAGP